MLYDLEPGTFALLLVAVVLTIWLVEPKTSPAFQRVFTEVDSWSRLLAELLIALFLVAVMLAWAIWDPGDRPDWGRLHFFSDDWFKEVYFPILAPALVLSAMLMLVRWRSYILLSAGPGILAVVLHFATVEPSGRFPTPYADLRTGILVADELALTAPLLVLLAGAFSALLMTRWSGRLWLGPIAAAVGVFAAQYLLIHWLNWGEASFERVLMKALIIGGLGFVPFLPGLRIITESWRNLCGLNPVYPWRGRHEACALLALVSLVAVFWLHIARGNALMRFESNFAALNAYRSPPPGLVSAAEVADPAVLRMIGNSSALAPWVLQGELVDLMKIGGISRPWSYEWVEHRDFWRSDRSAPARRRIDEIAPALDAFHAFALADIPTRGNEPSELREGTERMMSYPDVLAFRVGMSIADLDHARALDDIRAMMDWSNPGDWQATAGWWSREAHGFVAPCLSWYIQQFRDDRVAIAAARDLVRDRRRMYAFPKPDYLPPLKTVEPYEIVPESDALRRLDLWNPTISETQYADRLTYFHTAFSLELYRNDHGKYPDSLAQLVPNYLIVEPREIKSGELFVYVLEPSGLCSLRLASESAIYIQRNGGVVLIPSDLRPSVE